MHKILLVNRLFGAGQQQYPVCGISTKVYGQAHYSAEHRGLVFEMSAAEYEAVAFDIVGNTNKVAGQVWVPVVLEEKADPLLGEDLKILQQRAREAGINSFGMTKVAIIAALNAADPTKPKPRCDGRGCNAVATQRAREFHFCDAHAPLDAEDMPGREPRKEPAPAVTEPALA